MKVVYLNEGENLSKSEVRNIAKGEVNAKLKSSETERLIRKITKDVLSDFFKKMWTHKNMWDNI